MEKAQNPMPSRPSRVKSFVLNNILALSAVGMIIILAGAFFFLWINRDRAMTGKQPTGAEEIRQIFYPPSATSSAFSKLETTKIEPSANITTRGTAAAIPQIAGAMTAYKNPALGFQTEMPAQWQATEYLEANQVVFADDQGRIYNIESISDIGQSLDDVLEQLKGSPMVSNIYSAGFAGESALQFDTNGQFRQGLAVIHAGRLFYIFGPDLSGGPLAEFSFLQ